MKSSCSFPNLHIKTQKEHYKQQQYIYTRIENIKKASYLEHNITMDMGVFFITHCVFQFYMHGENEENGVSSIKPGFESFTNLMCVCVCFKFRWFFMYTFIYISHIKFN